MRFGRAVLWADADHPAFIARTPAPKPVKNDRRLDLKAYLLFAHPILADRRRSADVTAPNVGAHGVAWTRERIAVTPAAPRFDDDDVVDGERDGVALSVVCGLDVAVRPNDGDPVRQARLPAGEPPRRALRPLDVRVELHRCTRAETKLDAQTAPVSACSAGIGPQPVLLDHDRDLRFDRLGDEIVRIAVVETDRRAHPVAVVFRSPPSAGQADRPIKEASRPLVDAENVDGAEVGVVARGDPLGNRRRKRLEDRID